MTTQSDDGARELPRGAGLYEALEAFCHERSGLYREGEARLTLSTKYWIKSSSQRRGWRGQSCYNAVPKVLVAHTVTRAQLL